MCLWLLPFILAFISLLSFIWWFNKINVMWTNPGSFAKRCSLCFLPATWGSVFLSFLWFFFHPFLLYILPVYMIILHLFPFHTLWASFWCLCTVQQFVSIIHSHSSLSFHRQCFSSWDNCPGSCFYLGLNLWCQLLVAVFWLTVWYQSPFWHILALVSPLTSSHLLPLLLGLVNVFFTGAESLIKIMTQQLQMDMGFVSHIIILENHGKM